MAINAPAPTVPRPQATWQAGSTTPAPAPRPTQDVLPGMRRDTYEFHVRDLDRSGSLNSKEFGPGKQEQAEFRNRDFDASGGLDLDEFQAPNWLVAEHMDAEAGFRLLDANQDQAIDSEEYGPGAERQDEFQARDRDDNGVILQGEYVDARKRNGN